MKVFKILPQYPRNITKLSKKNRKPCEKTGREGVLEYGKTGIIFTLPDDMWNELDLWYDWNEVLTSGQFDVVLNPADNRPWIELMFVDNTPFYKSRDTTLENTSECPDVIAQVYYKSLPEWIRESVGGIYVCDYMYISDEVEFVGEI